MNGVTLEIPDSIVKNMRVPRKRAGDILMEELALRLFEDGVITSGQGAQLLSMHRLEFESFLARNRVSLMRDDVDLEKDLENLERVVPQNDSE